ncbi:NAD(P)/FAD-dependent oxidoreductase [Actinomadura sp. 1N219]|uniref:NAD(P)/FAD-dependent oxidoreductase n=1 Tax=Actinomadura sp. 1N219 TaxID=3375152 RepID=UPI00378F3AB9
MTRPAGIAPRGADAVVVGAGIIGLFVALELAGRGLGVVVLDRSTPGRAASVRNGGGVRLQGRAILEIPLAREALDLWDGLDDRLGAPTGFRRCGHLAVAYTAGQLESLHERASRERPHGVNPEPVDAATVREMAPGLAPTYTGGVFSAPDGMAVPELTMSALIGAAERAGVTIVGGAAVDGIDVAAGKVTAVRAGELTVATNLAVNAAGPWSPTVAALVDDYLPVTPSRLHMFRTVPLARFADVWVASAAMDFNGVQWTDGSVVFGAATRPDPTQYTFSLAHAGVAARQARTKLAELAPALAAAPFQGRWTGVREFAPDMIPIIGPGPVDGYFTCTGFSGHGFALAPAVGRHVAGWLESGERPPVLRPFDPGRFATPTGPFARTPAPWGGATTAIASADTRLLEFTADDGPATASSGVPAAMPAIPHQETA